MMNNPTTTLTQDTNGRHLPTSNCRRPLIPIQGGAQRRPIFRSQIPVRIPLNPERQRAIEARMRLAFIPRNSGPYTKSHTTTTARRVALSLSETQSVVKNVDTAFNVYNDRLEADFRDFRSLCGALVAQEHQEKEQWRLLCAKIMKERDAARAVINANVRSAASPTEGGELMASSTLKRDREGINGADARSASHAAQSSSELHPRPIRSLPSSRSPSPLSPTQHLQPYSEPSTPPPDSATSENGPCTPPNRSAPPLMTVFRASRSPTPIKIEEGAAEPLPKRRRSSDFSVSSTDSIGTAPNYMHPRRAIPPRPSIHSKPPPAPPLPNEFSHVDIMYVPMNGALVCRACLLATSKGSANQPPPEPKSFPTNAPWDDLREHCVRSHPDACVDVARLHPAEIFELRRRLNM